MRFGKQTTVISSDNVHTIVESSIVDFTTTRTVTHMKETVKVRSESDAHAEYLKLLDRRRRGEISAPGIQHIEKDGHIVRVELHWTVEDTNLQ